MVIIFQNESGIMSKYKKVCDLLDGDMCYGDRVKSSQVEGEENYYCYYYNGNYNFRKLFIQLIVINVMVIVIDVDFLLILKSLNRCGIFFKLEDIVQMGG